MNFAAFTSLLENASAPVVLIEGRRAIPEPAAQSAAQLSRWLAEHFARLCFRSGNATGTDEAFSRGVLEVDPSRLQVIAPYAQHRVKFRHPLAQYTSPEALDETALRQVQQLTIEATPAHRGLMKCYGRGGRTAAQAACLLRDTMKVTGVLPSFPPPVAALFWVDPSCPDAGGTGHTIRVCRLLGIPVILQNAWQHWPDEAKLG